MQTFAHRGATLERLRRERFDVAVVGGGIVGAGTAALAAQAGLRVALLERADFASGTSSASSKLVHGGLRYLRMGDFRLVREALREARMLQATVAPHLVEPLDFVLPVYRGGPYGTTAMRAALAAYGYLSGSYRERGRLLSADAAAARVPLLRGDGLRAAGVYRDARTNDARLTLANVRAAAEAGAAVANRVEVAAIARSGDDLVLEAHDALAGEWLDVRARHVVNATGAAVDELRRLEDPRAGTSVARSKGAHLVLDLPGAWDAALTIPVDRDRVSFAIPWEGMLLLGTTDTPVEVGEDALDVTEAEQRQILDEAAHGLPREALGEVRARFAGLRVLPLTEGTTARARREVVLSRGRLGVLSVAGGKLTTYRLIAGSVLRTLGIQPPPARPLAGACDPRELDVEPALARHLARTYGSLAHEVLAVDRPDALEPLAPGALDVVAQAVHARDREWAHDADDVLRRRTTLALRGLDTPAVRERVRSLLAEPVAAA